MFRQLPLASGSITLRMLRADDLPAFHRVRSDAGVARFQGWSPLSMPQAAEFLEGQLGHRRLVPGQWHQIAIAATADDRLVGDMGVWMSNDERQSGFGLSIDPACQGRGYGTAAVRALVNLLFSATPVLEVLASADVRNVACLAMLDRAGMRRRSTGTAVYKGERCTEHHFFISREPAAENASTVPEEQAT